jgi:hypothetical protein
MISVTQTAALLTTPPSMTLLLASRMAVGSPTRAIPSPNQAANPRVNRSKSGTIELHCRQQKNEFMISLSVYQVVSATGIASSNLRPSLRHPAKPVQPTRRTNIETNVNPQEPEISPPISKANTGRLQERRRRAYRTVLADTRGRRIHDVAPSGADVL